MRLPRMYYLLCNSFWIFLAFLLRCLALVTLHSLHSFASQKNCGNWKVQWIRTGLTGSTHSSVTGIWMRPILVAEKTAACITWKPTDVPKCGQHMSTWSTRGTSACQLMSTYQKFSTSWCGRVQSQTQKIMKKSRMYLRNFVKSLCYPYCPPHEPRHEDTPKSLLQAALASPSTHSTLCIPLRLLYRSTNSEIEKKSLSHQFCSVGFGRC